MEEKIKVDIYTNESNKENFISEKDFCEKICNIIFTKFWYNIKYQNKKIINRKYNIKQVKIELVKRLQKEFTKTMYVPCEFLHVIIADIFKVDYIKKSFEINCYYNMNEKIAYIKCDSDQYYYENNNNKLKAILDILNRGNNYG